MAGETLDATNHPRHAVLYIGVSSDLFGRTDQHKEKWDKKSFTARYNVDKVVYFEMYGEAYSAINREKQIKRLVRRKKIELIENANPEWKDLIELSESNDEEIELILKKVENNMNKKER